MDPITSSIQAPILVERQLAVYNSLTALNSGTTLYSNGKEVSVASKCRIIWENILLVLSLGCRTRATSSRTIKNTLTDLTQGIRDAQVQANNSTYFKTNKISISVDEEPTPSPDNTPVKPTPSPDNAPVKPSPLPVGPTPAPKKSCSVRAIAVSTLALGAMIGLVYMYV